MDLTTAVLWVDSKVPKTAVHWADRLAGWLGSEMVGLTVAMRDMHWVASLAVPWGSKSAV